MAKSSDAPKEVQVELVGLDALEAEFQGISTNEDAEMRMMYFYLRRSYTDEIKKRLARSSGKKNLFKEDWDKFESQAQSKFYGAFGDYDSDSKIINFKPGIDYDYLLAACLKKSGRDNKDDFMEWEARNQEEIRQRVERYNSRYDDMRL